MELPARLLAIGLALSSCLAWSQPPSSEPSVDDMQQQLQGYRRALMDFGSMIRYGSADAETPAPKPGEDRVVFFGDDITEAWGKGTTRFFPGKPYFNRGIRRQVTSQMLVRFRQDVVGMKAKLVVLEAGTNDIANLMGPGTLGTGSDNIRSMTEIAKANGIRVILASILPICDCTTSQSSLRDPNKIDDWNDWIKSYAEQSNSIFLDYHSALANGQVFKRELTADGFLPNDAGYEVMAPLAEKAIAQALGK